MFVKICNCAKSWMCKLKFSIKFTANFLQETSILAFQRYYTYVCNFVSNTDLCNIHIVQAVLVHLLRLDDTLFCVRKNHFEINAKVFPSSNFNQTVLPSPTKTYFKFSNFFSSNYSPQKSSIYHSNRLLPRGQQWKKVSLLRDAQRRNNTDCLLGLQNKMFMC